LAGLFYFNQCVNDVNQSKIFVTDLPEDFYIFIVCRRTIICI